MSTKTILSVNELCVSIAEREIIQNLSVKILPGEIHFLMGPNGSGKSTLASAIMGSPHVRITGGTVHFNGEDITVSAPEERAKRGLYLGFQYPAELAGVGMVTFLRSALAAKGETLSSEEEFRRTTMAPMVARVGLPEAILERNVNEGFSGGEKKRNEILQLRILKPKLAILDEFDSGLDVDGLRAATSVLKEFLTPDRALFIITHYGKIVEYVEPHRVHVMVKGRIVESGGKELIGRIEDKGYGGL